MPRHLKIFDTTMRDGEQGPNCSMTITEKVQMAQQLEKLNVDIIEAGYPVTSEGDFAAVKAVAESVENCTVAAISRTNIRDIDVAWLAIKAAKKPRLHTFIATSDIHLKHKLNMTRHKVLQRTKEAVTHARQYTEDVEFSMEDASRTELLFLLDVIAVAVEAGATTINIPDTVGYLTPSEYGAIFTTVREKLPETKNIDLSAHTHNDLGLAVANTLAAVEHGADQVECTINGIGQRAGNCSLEEVVMAIATRPHIYDVTTTIKTRQLYKTSQLLSTLIGFEVQPNKAVIGKNAFAHQAAIHQDAVLKNPLTYEILTPESVGVPGNKIVLGKHSGLHALHRRVKELGYKLSEEEMYRVFKDFTRYADYKKNPSDSDLKNIILNKDNSASIDFVVDCIQDIF